MGGVSAACYNNRLLIRIVGGALLLVAVACRGAEGGIAEDGTGTGLSTGDGTQDGAEDGSADGSADASGDGSGDGTAEGSESGQPQTQCGPTGQGPYWLQEGETVAVPITCTTGLALQGEDFALQGLPAGATFDDKTATLHWTPGLDQAAVVEIEMVALPFDEIGSVKIGVADAFDDPRNVPVLDPTAYPEEYGLPVVFLDTTPALDNETYSPATITAGGHVYDAEAKLRGASSLDYPKNNYTLKFTKLDKFSAPQYAGGFVDKRKVVLTSTFDDNTHVRQRMSFAVWNALDPGHIQVQTYNGVVFLDGEYHGLYVVSDHIDEYLMEDHGLDQAGNLFKARTHDANFRLTNNDGDPKATPHDGLSKAEGTPVEGQPGAFDDLDALVQFVATAPSASFLAEVDARIDRRDYENWWIAVSMIEAGDSGGKNSYHYHDPAGGPFRVVPWDFNHSFGQDWRTIRTSATRAPEDYADRNELFARFFDEPTVVAPLGMRYGQVLRGAVSQDTVLSWVDAWVSENRASALRDQSRWGEAYRTYSRWRDRDDLLEHDAEVAYLRQWIRDRWAFLLARYPS